MSFRNWFTAAVFALAGTTVGASGQEAGTFPTKPLRFVLNASPGGGSDIMARTMQPALEEALGQSVVVENLPGGGSATQLSVLSRAPADGYTFGSVTNSHIGNFHQTLRQYDVDKFDWVAGLVSEPFVLAVSSATGLASLEDVVGRVKSGQPFTVGGFFRGSGGHMTWEMFSEQAGLPKGSRWVPFDSIGDAVTAALGGHVDAVVAYTDLVQEHDETGSLKVLAVQSDHRVAQLPNAPTFAEAGYPIDPQWQQFRGIIAPKGVPDEVKAKLVSAFERAIASPAFQAYMQEASLVQKFMPPEAFTAYAKQQDATTSKWMSRLGMTQ